MLYSGNEMADTATPDAATVLTNVYVGGSSRETFTDLALDSQNRPVVTGFSTTPLTVVNNYPVTPNAYQMTPTTTTDIDAIVTQFDATGQFRRYSSYLSGNNFDRAYGVAVDEQDDIYVIGQTLSQTGVGITPPTAWKTTATGGWDAFIVRIDPSRMGMDSLIYGTLLGGSSTNDRGYGIAARNNIAYVTGVAGDAAMLEGPVQSYVGNSDIFVAALDTLARRMPWSTFLGGSSFDEGQAIGLSALATIHVAGATDNNDQALVAQVRDDGPIRLSITDFNGQPVYGLTTNDDGWPMLNASGSGAIANPVTVTAIIANTTAQTQQRTINLTIGQTVPDITQRFYVASGLVGCTPTYTGRPLSYSSYQTNCVAVDIPAGTTKEYAWQVWVQPSEATTIPIQARINDISGTLMDTEVTYVAVPRASIRPMVVVPGYMGSWPRNDAAGTKQMMLDPILGVYQGLTTELEVLGYEPGISLASFPIAGMGILSI